MALPKKEQPKVFTVGEDKRSHDFTPDEFEKMVYEVAVWFGKTRNVTDTVKEAREVLKQCLEGKTQDGRIWKSAGQNFNNRVRAKASYDLEAHDGIVRSKFGRPKKARKQELSDGTKVIVEQTDHAKVLTSQFNPKTYRDRIERDLYKAYPELDNPAYKPNVRRLSLLYAEQELIDLEMQAASGNANKRQTLLESLDKVQKNVAATMAALDIHPNQLRKKLDKRREGSLGDLVAALDGDADFAKREKDWALQLAYQLWWMHNHPNGRGDGVQMEEWEIWHMTRSRPIKHTCRCGQTDIIVEGFTPKELREYLLRNGMNLTQPALPVIKQRELWGIMKEEQEDGEPAGGDFPGIDPEGAGADQGTEETEGDIQ